MLLLVFNGVKKKLNFFVQADSLSKNWDLIFWSPYLTQRVLPWTRRRTFHRHGLNHLLRMWPPAETATVTCWKNVQPPPPPHLSSLLNFISAVLRLLSVNTNPVTWASSAKKRHSRALRVSRVKVGLVWKKTGIIFTVKSVLLSLELLYTQSRFGRISSNSKCMGFSVS